MTIREIINHLDNKIIQYREEIAKLHEELDREREEKTKLLRELHALKRKQTRLNLNSYISPAVEVAVVENVQEHVSDNGDSDAPVVEEVPEKPKRIRKKKDTVAEVVE